MRSRSTVRTAKAVKAPSGAPALASLALSFALAAAAEAPFAADAEADYRKGLAAYRAEDVVVAMASLERAARAGHPRAQTLLGYILDKAEEDAEAASFYRMAADQGDPEAAYWLAALYAAGDGVPKNPEEAFRLFEAAATAGYGPAVDVVAEVYLTGVMGQAQDPQKALNLLRSAADAGYEPARARIADLQRAGGVE